MTPGFSIKAMKRFSGSLITKHNRAGKGLGVWLFHAHAALTSYVESDAFEDSADGIMLIQEYIRAPEPSL